MNYPLTMPSLGADMDEGKLLEWHIKPGDKINKGDLIAVVETQKAAVEIESFRSGRVQELIAKIDDIIPVGQVIATLEIETDSAEAPAAAPTNQVASNLVNSNLVDANLAALNTTAANTAAAEVQAAQPSPIAAPETIAPAKTATASGERLLISPAARRLADAHKLDLTQIKGTGREGAIELRDIEPLVTTPAKTGAGNSLINIREAIARVMSRSKREIPHYYLQSQFVVDTLVTWLDTQNRNSPPEQRLFMPAVLMRAIVLALKTNSAMNGFYENGIFTPSSAIHLGITVSLKPDGVMTPAILDAQDLSLSELNAAFADLVQRARAGKLRNREMTDGTITVTNVGDLGADAVTGVIFAPQVALIGLGRIHKAAVVDTEGGLRAGLVLNATLSADHRVTDGLAGSKLLSTLGRLLTQPEGLV